MKKIIEKRKFYILPILFIISIITVSSFIFAADDNFQVTISTDSKNNIVISIDATKNIKKVELYKKQSDGKYSVFYQRSNVNGSRVTITVPTNRLSRINETDLRVKVTYSDGTKVSKNVTAPQYVPPTPASTPTPTPAPTVAPTSAPAPTPAPTPTQLPSEPTSDPGTSPTPTPTPTASPSDPTTTPSPTETPQPDTSRVVISTTKQTVMLDKNHYNFTFFDVTVKPSTAKVTYKSSNTKVATVSNKGKIVATGYGTAKITATAENNGAKASVACNIRVITTMKEKTSDSTAFVNRKGTHAGEVYYIRNYKTKTNVKNWSQKKINEQHWSDEEVESYINNMAWIQKTYQDKVDWSEVKQQTFYTHGISYNTNKPTKHKSWVKPKGEITSKNAKYLLLFTSKNQCLYLLQRNNKGTWNVNYKIVSSGGYYWGSYSKCVSYAKIDTANTTAGVSFYMKPSGNSDMNRTNSLHPGACYGVVDSLGCIRLGEGQSTMYKKIESIMKSSGELKIIYY